MNELIDTQWDKIQLDIDPDTRISRNFKLYELCRSETAARQLIDNSFPSEKVLRAAVYLCREVMQPIRDEFGPMTPNSVFRSQALERVLKNKGQNWISDSQHTMGQACDLEVTGVSTLDLANWVKQNLEFDQVICECFNPEKGVNSGWVHVSLVPPGERNNRHEELSYIFDPRKKSYVYVEGLRASVSV